jgi:hypothetical protein
MVRPLLALSALLFVGACSDAQGPRYPDLSSFCNARASAECNMQVILACASPNSSMCVAKRQLLCVSSMPPGTTYNSSSADGCVSQVSNAYADARITVDESNAIDAACLTVFDGPGDTDAVCFKDSDCKVSTGLRCVGAAGSSQGACEIPRDVDGGGSCSALDALCASGFHCGPTMHCDINGAMNEACDQRTPCAMNLQCSNAGLCVPRYDDGSACMTADECMHGMCDMATTATGVCVSELNLAPSEPFCVESR